jgi:hypothetical protein
MALFRSKINYAMNIITIFDKNSRQWYESFLYTSIKELLGIKENVSKSHLLEVCLGKSFEEYIQQEQQNTISKMINYPIQNEDMARANDITNFCDFNKLQMPEQIDNIFQHVYQELPLKAYLKAELRHQLKWKLQFAFSMRGIQYAKLNCPCNPSQKIHQKHI